MQHLILPLNTCQLGCGYKNAAYQKSWGFVHYGWDLYDPSLTLWAMGEGEVMAAGNDSIFGGTVIVVYKEVYVHGLDKVMDLTARCYHLSRIDVKAGDVVTTKTRLGILGTTGKYSSGVHLHVEFDRDVKDWMCVPGLAKDGTLVKRGIDTTVSPKDVLYVKESPPDRQSFAGAGPYWYEAAELTLPVYPEEETGEVDKLKAQVADLRAQMTEWQKRYDELNTRYETFLEKLNDLITQMEG